MAGATLSSQNIFIERSYAPQKEACAQAVEKLLKSLPSKEGGPETAPDDATKGFRISEKEKGGRHVER